VCSADNSGLSTEALDTLIANIESGNAQLSDEQSFIDTQNKTSSGETFIAKSGNYKKVNDNAFWPCDNFFCIIVSFKMYNHILL